MFPIPWNFPFRKKNGDVTTIGEVVGGGGSDIPSHTTADAGKVLTVGDDGSLEWNEKGAGGGDSLLNYNFTKYGERTVMGVNFSSVGAEFTTDKAMIDTGVTFNDITVYIDVDSLNFTEGGNKRLLMATVSSGFVYRSTGYWGLYSNNWYMSEISDPAFFDNSKIKIYIDSNGLWHIYRNNVLVFEPNATLNNNRMTIGSNDGNSINGTILTGVRIYAGDYTE